MVQVAGEHGDITTNDSARALLVSGRNRDVDTCGVLVLVIDIIEPLVVDLVGAEVEAGSLSNSSGESEEDLIKLSSVVLEPHIDSDSLACLDSLRIDSPLEDIVDSGALGILVVNNLTILVTDSDELAVLVELIGASLIVGISLGEILIVHLEVLKHEVREVEPGQALGDRIADERNLAEVERTKDAGGRLNSLLDDLDLEVSVSGDLLLVHEGDEHDGGTADRGDTILGTLLDRVGDGLSAFAGDPARDEVDTVDLAIHILAGGVVTTGVRNKLEVEGEAGILGVQRIEGVLQEAGHGVIDMGSDKGVESDRAAIVLNLNAVNILSSGFCQEVEVLIGVGAESALRVLFSNVKIRLGKSEVSDGLVTGDDGLPIGRNDLAIIESGLELHHRDVVLILEELRVLNGIIDSCVRNAVLGLLVSDALEDRSPDLLVSLDGDILPIHSVESPLGGVKREGGRVDVVVGDTDLAESESLLLISSLEGSGGSCRELDCSALVVRGLDSSLDTVERSDVGEVIRSGLDTSVVEVRDEDDGGKSAESSENLIEQGLSLFDSLSVLIDSRLEIIQLLLDTGSLIEDEILNFGDLGLKLGDLVSKILLGGVVGLEISNGTLKVLNLVLQGSNVRLNAGELTLESAHSALKRIDCAAERADLTGEVIQLVRQIILEVGNLGVKIIDVLLIIFSTACVHQCRTSEGEHQSHSKNFFHKRID